MPALQAMLILLTVAFLFLQNILLHQKMTPNSAVLSVFIGTITENEVVTITVKHVTFLTGQFFVECEKLDY